MKKKNQEKSFEIFDKVEFPVLGLYSTKISEKTRVIGGVCNIFLLTSKNIFQSFSLKFAVSNTNHFFNDLHVLNWEFRGGSHFPGKLLFSFL